MVQALRRRDSIAVEKSPDQSDEIQFASQRELAIRNLDRESNLLRDVRAALQRMDDGSFGTCLRCDTRIGGKRLAAVPWAALCIQCQEVADRNGPDSDDGPFLDAA